MKQFKVCLLNWAQKKEDDQKLLTKEDIMKKFLFITFLFLLPLTSFAQYNGGSSYDWRTNSHYSWDTDGTGNTTVRGYNYNSGGMWRTNIDPNGSMRGTDSQGNYWKYNSNTNTYYNYGTGKMCTGSGYSRTCF